MITAGTNRLTPVRVVVNGSGHAVTPVRALHDFGLMPDVFFLRDDGWCLGATSECEAVAFRLWRDHWTHFQRVGGAVKPISEYKPNEDH